ncbi:MAG: hypothetical protein ACI4SB_08720, partial [Acutalibacteraceae bacterium]
QDDLYKIVSMLTLSNSETEKLYDKFFELEYGKKEFKRVKYIFDVINKAPDYFRAEKPQINPVSDLKNLSCKADIVSAANYIIENSKGEISTNYSFSLENLDELFFYFVKNESFKFRHLISVPFDAKGTEDLENLFSCVRYMFEGCFPYFIEIPSFKSNVLIYPYFIVSEKYVMVFDESQGTVIESESFAASFTKRINERYFEKAVLTGAVPGDIFEIKDIYSKSFVHDVEARYELSPYPCVAPYGDKEFFSSIAVDSMPPDVKHELVNVCYDHYRRMCEKAELTQVISYDALDKLIERRVVDEIPASYAKLTDEEHILEILIKMLEDVKEGKIYILDDSLLHISNNIFVELNPVFITLSGTDMSEENFTVPSRFYAAVYNKGMAMSLRNFFDYIIRSRKVLPKDVAVGHLENRIVQVRSRIENKGTL